MGVAITYEGEHRTALAVGTRRGCKPDLAGAALHLVAVIAVALVDRGEAAAELDNVAVAIVPLVEQGEIFDDLVDIHGFGHACTTRFRHDVYIVSECGVRLQRKERQSAAGWNRPLLI